MLKDSTSISFKDIPLFQGLSSAEINTIKPFLKEKSFTKEEIIFSQGDECERILIVQSGQIKISRMSLNGKEQILEVLEAGDTCACNSSSLKWHCPATGEALTDCRVWFFPRSQYEHLVNTNHKLLKRLNQIFAERLCHFCSLIEDITLEDPDKRLAKFILDMVEAQGKVGDDNIHYFIAFTHEEISQRLGLVRETVTRHLNKLKRLKLIDIKPHQIIVLKEEDLKRIIQS